MTVDNHIFPADQMLVSMKDGPYTTTAHAVAELIDNSADAQAKEIGIVLIVSGKRRQPETIAVLDNGDGMSHDVLKHCLQWGWPGKSAEKKQNTKNRKPLGKFGVGLVAASFSQCSDMQIFSWQENEAANGNAVPSTRLSEKDGSETLRKNVLPDPETCDLPDWTSQAFTGMPTHLSEMPHGTLVIWRDVATRNWATTLQKQLRDLSGRIYRERIRHDSLIIVVNVYNRDTGTVETKEALAVDPTFLSNWPIDELEKWGFKGNTTLFQPYTGHIGDTGRDASGARDGLIVNVPHGASDEEAQGIYILTASYRSERAANDDELTGHFDDPGDAPYGKLADRLKGVSFLRNGREINLDARWLRSDKTVDRWVSVSVDFDSSLDSIFGISHDKQQVRDIAELASKTLDELNEEIRELKQSGTEDDSDYLERLQVAWKIKDRLKTMQGVVKKQRKGSRPRGGSSTSDPTVATTPELVDVGNRMLKGGRELPMDTKLPADDPKATEEAYEDSLFGDKQAREVRPQVVQDHELNLDYARAQYATPAEMFHINVGNHMVVHFHERHALSDAMVKLLVPKEGDDPPTIQDALRVIRSLIAAYARVMAEADRHDPNEARELRKSLLLWSQKSNEVFKDLDD